MNEAIRSYLLGIALAAPIGPASVTVIKTGLKWGFVRAFPTGLGITTADLTYMLIVYFGLASFVTIPLVKVVMWSMGAVVLVYLGLESLREGGRKLDLATDTASNTPRNPFLVGYLVNIANPLAVIFWLGIFGSLISENSASGPGLDPLLKGASILLGILTWHTMMSILTQWGKQYINPKTARIISIVAGIALLAFGIRFAYNVVIAVIAL